MHDDETPERREFPLGLLDGTQTEAAKKIRESVQKVAEISLPKK